MTKLRVIIAPESRLTGKINDCSQPLKYIFPALLLLVLFCQQSNSKLQFYLPFPYVFKLD